MAENDLSLRKYVSRMRTAAQRLQPPVAVRGENGELRAMTQEEAQQLGVHPRDPSDLRGCTFNLPGTRFQLRIR